MARVRRPGARVNYAATLAVLVVLAFFFPLAVRVASRFEVPLALSASALSALGLLVLAGMLIRWRVSWYQHLSARVAAGLAQVEAAPTDAASYHMEGEHLSLLLLRLGRRRAALDILERYACVPGVEAHHMEALRARLAAQLRRAGRGTQPSGAAQQDAR